MKLIRKLIRKITIKSQKLLCEEIVVLGDSHARVFLCREIFLAFPFHWFNVIAVDGATVSGLHNPNSTSQAMPIFKDTLQKSAAKTVIFLLGEVDVGFVIWHRAQKKRQGSVAAMLNSALDNYKDLILWALAKNIKVICVSAPLPTIKDDQDWGKIANLRRDIKASQRERTVLTLEFNSKMKKFCKLNGVEYVDLDADSIGKDGLVNSRLLNKDPADHHYDKEAYASLVARNLKACSITSRDSMRVH